MTQIKPIDRKQLRFFKRYGNNIPFAEVFDHPYVVSGGIVIVTDCSGERYYEDRAIGGFDECLKVARYYK